MRSIKIIFMITIPLLFAAFMLTGLLTPTQESEALSHASSDHTTALSRRISGKGDVAPEAPAIRPSLRISIPYGFSSFFPLRSNGQEVLVSGHGSCTAGETFSVAVTVTQTAGGAVAHGHLNEACAGEAILQAWQITATAESDYLSVGPAETCGFVQTYEGASVTDEQAWCVNVNLGDYLFLPMILR